MSEILPFSLFIVMGVLWGITWLQCHWMLFTFAHRHPREAIQHFPLVSSGLAHPENLLYFLRRENREFLRQDPVIWEMRQRVVWLMAFSLTFPVLALLAIGVVALSEGFGVSLHS
jgi:hypothetical protein